jgi:glycerol-3-phosphate dehydrogenase
MKSKAVADIAIFGGGIAGLWLLNRLRQAGFSTLLFESSTLGGGQTHKAQGIIHGGMKYALQGFMTQEAKTLANIPARWQACLTGQGEIDLAAVPILSPSHYLWSNHRITAKLTGFLAGAALTSKVNALAKQAYPPIFHHPAFKGEVFALDEMVIDVPALIRELVKNTHDAVFKIEPLCSKEIQFDENGQCVSATVYMAGKALEIKAQQFIFTAGIGNEIMVKKFNQPVLAAQRRPLHMVLVKLPHDYSLYAHCLGFGTKPRLTITTHYTQEGQSVWYIGGQLAEEGITRSQEEQIKAAQQELHLLFPWLDFSGAQFASFMVDRAEPYQSNGLKPNNVCMKTMNNITIAWPIKLALAPILAEEILQHLHKQQLSPQLCDLRELRPWPMPPLAQPIWEELFCKNVA